MRASAIAGCVMAIVLLVGGLSAASGGDLRRVVVFRDGTPLAAQQQTVVKSGSRVLRALSLIDGLSIELPAVGTDAALAYLQAHPDVAGVYDDPTIRTHGVLTAQGAGGDGAGGDGAGGDGAGGDQIVLVTPVAPPALEIYPWGIERIGAAEFQETSGLGAGQGIKVAVFDTGLDRTHPDLANNIVGGFNAIAGQDPANYDDDNGHGTAMAGIIAARVNQRGIIGAAPGALIYAVKVLDRNGQGHTSDGIYALGEIVKRQDIRVINMSYGTSLVWPLFPLAIKRAQEAGKIIVASRGNRCASTGTGAQGAGGDGAGGDGAGGDGAGGDGAGGDGAGGDGAGGDGAGGDGAGGDGACSFSALKFPAAYPEVISVGASTATNKIASYSLWGGVDVVAPGGGGSYKILTTNRGGGYGLISGTSPAAAHVSGAVAVALRLRPTLTLEQVLSLLQQTAHPLGTIPFNQQGAGLIDVNALADALKK